MVDYIKLFQNLAPHQIDSIVSSGGMDPYKGLFYAACAGLYNIVVLMVVHGGNGYNQALSHGMPSEHRTDRRSDRVKIVRMMVRLGATNLSVLKESTLAVCVRMGPRPFHIQAIMETCPLLIIMGEMPIELVRELYSFLFHK
jgi:hypothetical protein